MKKVLIAPIVVIAALACAGLATGVAGGARAEAGSGRPLPKGLAGLAGPFDLGGEKAPAVRYYVQETQFVHIGFDGKRTGIETYTVKMRLVPAALSGKDGDEYTVREARIRAGGQEAETIPKLAGWSYIIRRLATGKDDKGQLFGVPHEPFEELTTSRGRKLTAVEAYPIYNSFIDFHSFNDVFARPQGDRNGIEDLKAIGQTIRHGDAFSEPPVDLGQGIKPGSVFKNGEIKLAFKGVGLVDGAPCAVIGYDSGESTLKMIMAMGEGQDIVTTGGSQYMGDLYIDLETRWMRRATLDEFVVTETSLPSRGVKVPNYTVRHLLTRMVGREEFEK
jgi:hypothetical protein